MPVMRLMELVDSMTKAAVPKSNLRLPSLTATAVPAWRAAAMVSPSSVRLRRVAAQAAEGGRCCRCDCKVGRMGGGGKINSVLTCSDDFCDGFHLV